MGLGKSKYTTSQHAAPALMGTHTVSAPPLARSTRKRALAAPRQSGSRRTATMVLTHLGIRWRAVAPLKNQKACFLARNRLALQRCRFAMDAPDPYQEKRRLEPAESAGTGCHPRESPNSSSFRPDDLPAP